MILFMTNETENRYAETKTSLFAAANTALGFRSFFGTLFSPDSGEWQKIYILKGGPGTGKSGFMKACADCAEKHGLSVERFFCSSDPASLDGIRIPETGTAILDGTPPHCTDPIHPGAVEEIINLGMFFDAERLRENLPAIRSLQEAGAAAHRLASRYLRAAGELREGQKKLAAPAYLEEKAKKAAYRLLRGKSAAKKGGAGTGIPSVFRAYDGIPLLESAVSTRGIVHLPTAEGLAAQRFLLPDQRRLAPFFLRTLADAAEERGIPVIRFGTPLDPDETEGVFFPEDGGGTFYYSDRYGMYSAEDRVLHTERFFDAAKLAQTREKYRFAKKCIASLTEGACDALREAGSIHDELETYYTAAMDFSAKEAFQRRFLRAMFQKKKAE